LVRAWYSLNGYYRDNLHRTGKEIGSKTEGL
jgi:hypothetical protein